MKHLTLLLLLTMTVQADDLIELQDFAEANVVVQHEAARVKFKPTKLNAKKIRKAFRRGYGVKRHKSPVNRLTTRVIEVGEDYSLIESSFKNANGLTVRTIHTAYNDNVRRPTMLIPNGFAGDGRKSFCISPKDYYHCSARVFADDGYFVATIYIPTDGVERTRDVQTNTHLFSIAAGETWVNAWIIDKVRSAIDYLETQPNFKKRKVGIYGCSMGGWASLIAGFADKRIHLVVGSGTNVWTDRFYQITSNRRFQYPSMYEWSLADRPTPIEEAFAFADKGKIVLAEFGKEDNSGVYSEIKKEFSKAKHSNLHIVDVSAKISGHEKQVLDVKTIVDGYFK